VERGMGVVETCKHKVVVVGSYRHKEEVGETCRSMVMEKAEVGTCRHK
jgi:hypothetical protein